MCFRTWLKEALSDPVVSKGWRDPGTPVNIPIPLRATLRPASKACLSLIFKPEPEIQAFPCGAAG